MNDIEIAQAVSNVLSRFTKTAPESTQEEAKAGEAERSPQAAASDALDAIVARALAQNTGVSVQNTPAQTPACKAGNGAFATMDQAIAAAVLAQVQYRHSSMQDRATFVQGIRDVFLQESVLQEISRMAVEETGMGNYADKLTKNRIAALKTPGLEDLTSGALSGDCGLTLTEYSAYGVIGSITPTTNPTETIINNSIGMLAAGNSVVFSPHPRSHKVSLHCIELINHKLASLGAPSNLVVTVTQPCPDNTRALINDQRINMLVATGGPAIVKTVMSSGKKAIGAGAGNPPAVVDETANIEKAARDIILGCSFDNNLPCVAEKEVIVVNQVADYLIHCMKKSGGYLLCDKHLIRQLESLVLNENGTGPDTTFVGKEARYILQQLGVSAPEEIKVILVETEKNHPFVVHELMMPVLPVVRVDNVDEAIELAVQVEQGNRHTAIMHSTNVEKLTKMARQIQTTIFVKNGPSCAGLGVGGEGHATFTIAGPTGEGLTSPRSFARIRRCVMVEGLNIR